MRQSEFDAEFARGCNPAERRAYVNAGSYGAGRFAVAEMRSRAAAELKRLTALARRGSTEARQTAVVGAIMGGATNIRQAATAVGVKVRTAQFWQQNNALFATLTALARQARQGITAPAAVKSSMRNACREVLLRPALPATRLQRQNAEAVLALIETTL